MEILGIPFLTHPLFPPPCYRREGDRGKIVIMSQTFTILKLVKKYRDFKYFMLNFIYSVITAKFMLITGLHPPLFEEERGNEGVS